MAKSILFIVSNDAMKALRINPTTVLWLNCKGLKVQSTEVIPHFITFISCCTSILVHKRAWCLFPAPCCLDDCQEHTKLLLNSVCHISGGEEEGRVERQNLQHFSRTRGTYLNRDKTAAGSSWSNSSNPLHRRNTALLYKKAGAQTTPNVTQSRTLPRYSCYSICAISTKQRINAEGRLGIIAPSNCLQTGCADTIGDWAYTNTNTHIHARTAQMEDRCLIDEVKECVQ